MIYSILYTIVNSLAGILIYLVGTKIPDALMIFLSTTYAIIFFHIINFKKVKVLYSVIITKYKFIYFQLSSLLLGTWIGSFLIPIYFSPYAQKITYMNITALCGSFSLFMDKKRKIHLIKGLLLSLNLVFYYIFYANRYSDWLMLVPATIVTGVCGFYYMKISEIFSRKNFSAIQILTVRFWLLWAVTFIYVLYKKEIPDITLKIVPETMIVGFSTLILQVYLAQKSIEKVGSSITGIFFGLTPIITIILQKLILGKAFDTTMPFAFGLSIIIIIYLAFTELHRIRF